MLKTLTGPFLEDKSYQPRDRAATDSVHLMVPVKLLDRKQMEDA